MSYNYVKAYLIHFFVHFYFNLYLYICVKHLNISNGKKTQLVY